MHNPEHSDHEAWKLVEAFAISAGGFPVPPFDDVEAWKPMVPAARAYIAEQKAKRWQEAWSPSEKPSNVDVGRGGITINRDPIDPPPQDSH